MSILKLPNAGDEATLTITGCERVEGQYGPQVKFVGESGETLYLPADSADRQLGRVFDFTAENGVDYGQAVGERLRFFRSPNTKKAGAAPYWNVEIATGPAPKPSKRLSAPPASAPTSQDPDAPLAGDEAGEGQPEAKDGLLGSAKLDALVIAKREAIESAYRWAYATALAVQQEVQDGASLELVTPDSVQAGAATILIQASQRGAI